MKSQNFNPAALAVMLLLHAAPLSAQPSQNPATSGLSPSEQQYLETLTPAQMSQLMQQSLKNPSPAPVIPAPNPPAPKPSGGFFANLVSSIWRLTKTTAAAIFAVVTSTISAILAAILTPHQQTLLEDFGDRFMDSEIVHSVLKFFIEER